MKTLMLFNNLLDTLINSFALLSLSAHSAYLDHMNLIASPVM